MPCLKRVSCGFHLCEDMKKVQVGRWTEFEAELGCFGLVFHEVGGVSEGITSHPVVLEGSVAVEVKVCGIIEVGEDEERSVHIKCERGW